MDSRQSSEDTAQILSSVFEAACVRLTEIRSLLAAHADRYFWNVEGEAPPKASVSSHGSAILLEDTFTWLLVERLLEVTHWKITQEPKLPEASKFADLRIESDGRRVHLEIKKIMGWGGWARATDDFERTGVDAVLAYWELERHLKPEDLPAGFSIAGDCYRHLAPHGNLPQCGVAMIQHGRPCDRFIHC